MFHTKFLGSIDIHLVSQYVQKISYFVTNVANLRVISDTEILRNKKRSQVRYSVKDVKGTSKSFI